METKTGIKVVRKTRNHMVSAATEPRSGGLTYKLNEVTKPEIEGTPIFIFEDEKAADNFIHGSSRSICVKLLVEYEPFSMQFSYLSCICALMCKDIYRKFWEKVTNGTINTEEIEFRHEFNFTSLMATPKGTIFAAWVKPIKILSWQ